MPYITLYPTDSDVPEQYHHEQIDMRANCVSAIDGNETTVYPYAQYEKLVVRKENN